MAPARPPLLQPDQPRTLRGVVAPAVVVIHEEEAELPRDVPDQEAPRRHAPEPVERIAVEPRRALDVRFDEGRTRGGTAVPRPARPTSWPPRRLGDSASGSE